MKRILLAIALLCTPAHGGGKTEILKTPTCVAGAAVKVIEPDVVFHPVYIKPKKLFGLVNIFYARKILQPCETPGLLRSVKDAKCYRKGRAP